MERYNIEMRLKSYDIDKELVTIIADYINYRIPMMFQEEITNSTLPLNTTIQIQHRDGSTVVKPIGDYSEDHFNGAIECLSIELAHMFGRPGDRKGIAIWISFGKEIQDSYLNLTVVHTNARERAIGIKDGLLSAMEYHKNNNKMFYPNENLPTVILIAGILEAIFATYISVQPWKFVLGSISAGSLYFFLHRYLKGYCSFDTARQKRLDIVYKWIATGIAGFILTEILTFVAKRMFF